MRRLDDRLRALGRVRPALRRGDRDAALLGDRVQVVRGRVVGRPGLQLGVVLGVRIDHLVDVAGAATVLGRGRDQPDQPVLVGIEQGVDHRLDVVGIRAADVGRDENAGLRHWFWFLAEYRSLKRGIRLVWRSALLETAPERVEEGRSEEHTSELQSLMRISYAVFCLK